MTISGPGCFWQHGSQPCDRLQRDVPLVVDLARAPEGGGGRRGDRRDSLRGRGDAVPCDISYSNDPQHRSSRYLARNRPRLEDRQRTHSRRGATGVDGVRHRVHAADVERVARPCRSRPNKLDGGSADCGRQRDVSRHEEPYCDSSGKPPARGERSEPSVGSPVVAETRRLRRVAQRKLDDLRFGQRVLGGLEPATDDNVVCDVVRQHTTGDARNIR